MDEKQQFKRTNAMLSTENFADQFQLNPEDDAEEGEEYGNSFFEFDVIFRAIIFLYWEYSSHTEIGEKVTRLYYIGVIESRN